MIPECASLESVCSETIWTDMIENRWNMTEVSSDQHWHSANMCVVGSAMYILEDVAKTSADGFERTPGCISSFVPDNQGRGTEKFGCATVCRYVGSIVFQW